MYYERVKFKLIEIKLKFDQFILRKSDKKFAKIMFKPESTSLFSKQNKMHFVYEF